MQRNIGSFNDVHIIIAEKIYRRVWHNKNSYLDQVGKGPSLYYVSKETGVGGVRKMAFFADVQYYPDDRKVQKCAAVI